MDAPCCDVFRLNDGKIQSIACYPSGTVILTQLGVLRIFENEFLVVALHTRGKDGKMSDKVADLMTNC